MTENPAVVRRRVVINVSKDALDIFIDSSAQAFQAVNQAGDIAALVERLKAVTPVYIVVEASGGFESGVVAALAAAGLPVCRVSPQRVRWFARAVGEWAKTDRLDAPLLGDALSDALQPGAQAVLRAAEEGG